MTDASKHYSESSFWKKVKGVAHVTGRKVIEPALTGYYTMKDGDTPSWARAAIVGALGYFILPIDAIPDVLLPLGFTDDLVVVAAAVKAVVAHVKPEHRAQARQRCDRILG